MLKIKDLQKSFSGRQILKDINISVSAGDFVVLVGPSGCGKSTLLRSIAGLETPDSGEIHIAGRNVTNVDAQNRDVAMVFQNYSLYPHMNVFENMAFGLKIRKQSESRIAERVNAIATMVKIQDFLHRKPKELSGGQKQRVALGRALARQAPLVLFDEPLSNLDAHLRQEMRFEIKRLHNELKNTVIYVTHDQSEALTLGDQIIVLKDGRIEQIATPAKLYAEPCNLFVAGFIGSPEMNFIPGKITRETFNCDSEKGSLSLVLPGAPDGDYILGIRPEDVKFSTTGWPMHVDYFENHGSFGLNYGHCLGHKMVALGPPQNLQSKNVSIEFNLKNVHLFDKITGLRQQRRTQ